MATEIVFENAQLADALGKANRLAPVKGAAFDKAAGFLLDVNPITQRMTVRSTDMDATYLQHVPAIGGKGDAVQWRLSSLLLAGMVQALPLGGENKVKMIDRDDGFIRLTSGKWVAKLHTLRPEDFPLITEFDQTGMVEANEFAAKVEQVAWACDKKSPILAGVHIDGKRLIGCSQYGVAVVPCPVGVDAPATVPLSSLATLLKSATDVRLRVAEKSLQIGLDAETQATARLIEGQYPNIDNVMRDDFMGSVFVHKQSFLDALNRMLVLIRTERMPSMQVTFDGTGLVKMVTFDMEVEQVGRMQDSIDVSGDWEDQFSIIIKPQMLVDAVEHSRADHVTIAFGNEDPARARKVPVRVTDDRGYNCHIMPIAKESL